MSTTAAGHLHLRPVVVLGGSTPPRGNTGDESFVLGAEGGDDEDVGDDGYWCWQSNEDNAARWVVPQWEVLAADRGGWRAGLKGQRVDESEVGVC
jgi:hypothetical protein